MDTTATFQPSQDGIDFSGVTTGPFTPLGQSGVDLGTADWDSLEVVGTSQPLQDGEDDWYMSYPQSGRPRWFHTITSGSRGFACSPAAPAPHQASFTRDPCANQKPKPVAKLAQGPAPRCFNLVRRVTKGPGQALRQPAEMEPEGLDAEIARVEIRDGDFSELLPNMTFLMNGRDEPRVAFNHRAPGAWASALVLNDSTPFMIQTHPIAEFFSQKNPRDSCSAPIMIADVGLALLLRHFVPNRDWRGMSNGGMIIGDNYRHFARSKLIDIAREHRDLMVVAITTFAETLCLKGCDRDAVIAEYNITGNGEPREDVYGYKYAMDVDGTTFSGRFLGLLRSGSLVFKVFNHTRGQSTIFKEYFNDWVRPFEHFVPILPDLSDLVEKLNGRMRTRMKRI
ncbi:hypothetical protein DFH06DRAFT_1144968 [Mycena polygramma]|nr:hypothetical protein DFH06DRAFT_1144968 [Mycena polygramma]